MHRNFFVCTVKATRKRIPKKNHRWDVAHSNSLIISNRRTWWPQGYWIHQFDFPTVPKNAATLVVSVKVDPHVLKFTTWSHETMFLFKLAYVASWVSNYYLILYNNFSTNFYYIYILHRRIFIILLTIYFYQWLIVSISRLFFLITFYKICRSCTKPP